MYSEGEDKYLKDIDCINIVKSIRELKAITRILLNQHQRQLLAFERNNVLLSNEATDKHEADYIQNKVPFEHVKPEDKSAYWKQVTKFVEEYAEKDLSTLDAKIIEEIIHEGRSFENIQSYLACYPLVSVQNQASITPKPVMR